MINDFLYCVVLSLAFVCLLPSPSQAYIDSGRGSTLIQRLAVFVLFLLGFLKRILRFFRSSRD
jgi:hypothetical protein